MADVKNFGLIGVGSSLQFSKGGAKLVNNAGTFNFKAANGTTDTAATASALTATTGDLTATAGNLVLTATGGTISVGTDTTLSRQQAGVFQFNGTAAFVAPVGNTAARPASAVEGMIRVNSDVLGHGSVEFFDGTAWTTLGSSGSVTALQTEVNNIETTLGSLVNSDGTSNTAVALTSSLFYTGGITAPVDLTTALNNLASVVSTDNNLNEIFASTAIGNVIYSGAGNVWTQAAPGATSNVQAYSLSLDNLAAKTSTGVMAQTGAHTFQAVSFSAADGISVVDSSATTGTIAFDTTGKLKTLYNFTSAGGLVTLAGDTWSNASISSTDANVTVTNGSGSTGSIQIGLTGSLASLGGVTTGGFAVYNSTSGTWSAESITGTAGNIVVTNGDGQASSPTVNLATVTNSGTGSFVKVSTDSFGRVTGTTAVVTSDITALADSQYVRQDGTSTMAGSLNLGGNTITNVATPVNPTDAANKSYVDNAVSGLTWKDAVVVKSAGNVAIAGPGATIDGVTLASGDRVLLTGQTTASENGIYVFNGAASAMTRSTDAATPAQLQGAAVFVESGTSANSGWVQTIDPLASFAAQVWAQFSGAGAYAGSGAVTVVGTTIGLTTGNGLTQTSTLSLNIDSASALNDTAGPLTLALQTAGGLNQTGSQLGISTAGVTNAMLANSSITLDGDTGTGSVALGGTLDVTGNAGQGIITAVTSGTVNITAADASTTQKGVASFDSTNFTVSSGAVSITAGSLENSLLTHSSFSITADAGTTDVVSLGGSFKIGGDAYITATSSGTGVALTLGTVDVAHGGTGLTSLVANEVLYGNGTSAVAQSANFTFDGTSTLTVGGALPLTFDGATGAITATATDSDIVLMPNGTGSVIVGPVGAGLIQSDAGTALTVQGNTGLTISGGANGITVAIASGTSSANKVSITGPSATDYATNLGANDLTNKQYVDTAIASGASAGAVKAFQATVPLNANGTTNIGTLMPAGATVLSVKVNVTTADTGATLSVGKSGGVAAYMNTAESDEQTQGLYMAECFVTESGSVQAIATVAGSSGIGAGSCVVIVTYQVAQ